MRNMPSMAWNGVRRAAWLIGALQLIPPSAMEHAIAAGERKIDGKREAFTELMGLLDAFRFWFDIVTP